MVTVTGKGDGRYIDLECCMICLLKRKVTSAFFWPVEKVRLVYTQLASYSISEIPSQYCVLPHAGLVQNKPSCPVLYHFNIVDQFMLVWVPDWQTVASEELVKSNACSKVSVQKP